MFKRIDHVELLTGDPSRMERFYTDVLGFRVRERMSIPGGLELTYLDLGGTTVELMCYADTPVGPAPATGARRLRKARFHRRQRRHPAGITAW